MFTLKLFAQGLKMPVKKNYILRNVSNAVEHEFMTNVLLQASQEVKNTIPLPLELLKSALQNSKTELMYQVTLEDFQRLIEKTKSDMISDETFLKNKKFLTTWIDHHKHQDETLTSDLTKACNEKFNAELEPSMYTATIPDAELNETENILREYFARNLFINNLDPVQKGAALVNLYQELVYGAYDKLNDYIVNIDEAIDTHLNQYFQQKAVFADGEERDEEGIKSAKSEYFKIEIKYSDFEEKTDSSKAKYLLENDISVSVASQYLKMKDYYERYVEEYSTPDIDVVFGTDITELVFVIQALYSDIASLSDDEKTLLTKELLITESVSKKLKEDIGELYERAEYISIAASIVCQQIPAIDFIKLKDVLKNAPAGLKRLKKTGKIESDGRDISAVLYNPATGEKIKIESVDDIEQMFGKRAREVYEEAYNEVLNSEKDVSTQDVEEILKELDLLTETDDTYDDEDELDIDDLFS